MAGTDSGIHPNNVELSSEDLLNELELMVDDYKNNDDLAIAGDD